MYFATDCLRIFMRPWLECVPVYRTVPYFISTVTMPRDDWQQNGWTDEWQSRTLFQIAGNQTSCCNKRQLTTRQCRSQNRNYTKQQPDAQTWACLFKSKAVKDESNAPCGKTSNEGKSDRRLMCLLWVSLSWQAKEKCALPKTGFRVP